MRICRLLTAALLALPLAVATAAPGAAQESGPAPVRVTNADSGRTVHLVPGQSLEVDLVPPSSGEQWQGPTSAGQLFLTAYDEGAERTTATLQALGSSSSPMRLRARTDRACAHSDDACPQAFSSWFLDVVVDSGPAAGGKYDCRAMPTPQVAPGHALVDEGSNGTRVQVELGKTVLVQLGGCQDPWTVPVSSGPLFRERVSYAAVGQNSTVFRALRLGTTSISAAADPICVRSTPPCARPSLLWQVDVEVVPAGCGVSPAAVLLDRSTIRATESARTTVRGTAGAAVELWAYTRPSTTYRLVRSGTLDGDGALAFDVRPPANTRLQARYSGCGSRPSVVLNLATALTLAVERRGTREYAFSGDSLPARPGGLVVSLYRVTAEGSQVLTAQARASEADGEWRLVRRFSGSGRFGFLARTGQDLLNAPGSSAVRSVLII